MNKRQKEILQNELNNEKNVIKQIKNVYERALVAIDKKIELLSANKMTQSKIYQKQYQEALKKQIEAILAMMNSEQYDVIQEYLKECYEDAFIGTLYDLQGQGIPLMFPINQEEVAQAIQHDTKLKKPLYEALGYNVEQLKKTIASEISRGIASSMMYAEIARNIRQYGGVSMSKALTIARTEGHRITEQARDKARHRAKEAGADVVKQWDSTLDSRTRPTHQKLDGQIRGLEEPFEVNGHKAQYPGGFGIAKEDINCRCVALQRARWALDEAEFEILKKRAEFFGLDKTKDFDDYKAKFLKIYEQMNNQFKIAFPDDVYKINGFTKSVKNEVDKAMQKLNNEYDIRLNSIVVEPTGLHDIFITGYHDGRVDMVVNQNANFERILSVINKRYNNGQFAGKSLEDYLAHEMAHCMLYQDCTTDSMYKAKYQQIEALYDNLKGISGYADKKKSGNEALAEAFVRVRNNEEVSPIVKVLVETYFNRWKK